MSEKYGWDDPLPRPTEGDNSGGGTEDTAVDCGHAKPPSFLDQPALLTELKNDCAAKVASLADLQDPQPEVENPAALFRNGWLRKGGGAFLVSTSGTGKSVFTIQAAILWAMGRAAFGIEPVRPLTVAIVQAEDDAEEMADFRNQITDGLVEEDGLDRNEVSKAIQQRVLLPNVVGVVGGSFIAEVGGILSAHPEIDLLIINPFQSYFGGDVSRNAELSSFLRTGLDPLIKPARAGVLFVHHTNKPPASKERTGWGTDMFAAYVGAGGAEIVNWTRAMLALMPCEGFHGLFQLTAGKRGNRLAWSDPDGNPTNKRVYAHSANRIFWRNATPEEAEAVSADGRGKREKGDPVKDAEQLADMLRKAPASYTDARALSEQLFPRTRARMAFATVTENPAAYFLSTVRAQKKAAMFIGVKAEAEALARAYNSKTGGKVETEGVLPT